MKRKNLFYTIGAIAVMAIAAFFFFFPDDIEGNVLQQHDIRQGIANGEEARAFHEATGETTRWTDSLFGGMPTFQISPSYPAGSWLDWVMSVYTLGLPSPANLVFAMMLGFFIMCLCMRMRWELALLGALAWGFSSYFIIIIGAGHIWKFVTLAYIPPTIGGLVLAYRGRYLAGGALAALFGALQLQSNHPQMSYYFGFVMLAMVLAWLWDALRSKEMKRWTVATLVTLGAGIIAIGINVPSLYNSYEYSKETIRGRSTLLTADNATASDNFGMSKRAITAWSYGIDETFTLLIPNVKGGASIKPVAAENQILSVAETDKAQKLADEGNLSQQELSFMAQFPQYFGEQPMTNGPVYVGAFICVLAIIALFIVPGAMKWALLAVMLLSIFLSWGHNFNALTNFFIDYVPGYNKFRTVSSMLVVVEFCIPLLAILALKRMLDDGDFYRNKKTLFHTVFGISAAICLLAWIAPSIFGNGFTTGEIEQLRSMGIWNRPEYQNLFRSIEQSRQSLVASDSIRSLIFIAGGWGILMLYFNSVIREKSVLICILCGWVLIDLFAVNKRYVNSDNFVAEIEAEATFEPTAADKAILADKGHYRVLDAADFGGARSSYFHKTIGGYHAAKLTRYNDLIDKQISKGNQGVLNMLNTKYVMSGEQYELNPDANGSAWFVERIDYVANPDAEMTALDSLDTKHAAVAQNEFKNVLGQASPVSTGDTITLRSYAPNKLVYSSRSATGGVGVFSEVWFPWGWNATIDGKPAEIGRVNYVLRALKIPAGEHEITFEFKPKSVEVTNTISYVSIALLYALCIAAAVVWIIGLRRKGEKS